MCGPEGHPATAATRGASSNRPPAKLGNGRVRAALGVSEPYMDVIMELPYMGLVAIYGRRTSGEVELGEERAVDRRAREQLAMRQVDALQRRPPDLGWVWGWGWG